MRRRRLIQTLLVAALLVVAAVVGAQAWLSSGVGRGMVESRLSSALGRPARLDGAFSLQLLPLPGVRGTRLKLFTRDGRWLLLDAGEYLVRLSLWSLLQGEVQIVALQAANAEIDLRRLAAEPSPAPAADDASPVLAVPDIRSFALSEVELYFDGIGTEPLLRIESLSVDGFTLGSPAPFETGLSLVSGGTEQFSVFARGSFTLQAQGLAAIDFSRLDAALTGIDVRGIRGALSADLRGSALDARLVWDDPEQQVGLTGHVDWSPGYIDVDGGIAIEFIELALGERRISGSGCLLDGDPPRLGLELSSAALDLDALAALAEKWQAPYAGPVESREGQGVDEVAAEDPPVLLALRLKVDQMTYGDTLASGARLAVGDAPDCPLPR